MKIPKQIKQIAFSAIDWGIDIPAEAKKEENFFWLVETSLPKENHSTIFERHKTKNKLSEKERFEFLNLYEDTLEAFKKSQSLLQKIFSSLHEACTFVYEQEKDRKKTIKSFKMFMIEHDLSYQDISALTNVPYDSIIEATTSRHSGNLLKMFLAGYKFAKENL